jgi:hypothetical protein
MGFFSDITGKTGVDQANARNQQRLDEALRFFDQIFAQQKGLFEEGRKPFEQAVGVLDQQFGLAQQLVSTQGQGLTQRTLDREQQAGSALSQRANAAGLGNTTGNFQMQNMVRGSTDRTLQDISEGVSGLQSGIAMQGGTARARALQALGGFYGQQAVAQGNLGQSKINLLGSVQDQAAGSPLGGFASLLGGFGGLATGLGSLFNMGGGGGGGTHSYNTTTGRTTRNR